MKQPAATPTATPMEALGIVTLCFGWFILASLMAVGAGFPTSQINEANLLSIVATELVLGSIALAVLRKRGYTLAGLLPSPSWQGAGIGLLLFVVGWIASLVVLVPFGTAAWEAADPFSVTVQPSLVSVLVLSGVNGLYEEVFLLGYLTKGLSHHGASLALGVSLLVRVLYHLYQGPYGALSVMAFGLVLGVFYLRTGWLWPAVFAHMFADAMALL